MDKTKYPATPHGQPLTESTRYLGETAFGTVEKVCAVCTVVNSNVADPKKIEKIYNYIQEMFGPEALDYEHAFTPRQPTEKMASLSHEMTKDTNEPLW